MGVVNPRQVREFARAAGRLAKTDRLDAAVIAHFAETFAPRPGQPDPVADRLGEHVLYRRSLQDKRVALKHQQRRLERGALQPCDQGVLSPAVGQRQAGQSGAGGLYAQDAGDAQRPGSR